MDIIKGSHKTLVKRIAIDYIWLLFQHHVLREERKERLHSFDQRHKL